MLRAILLVALATPVFAQLKGTVKDASGGVIPNVAVTVSGPASRSTVTDPEGRYEFANLPNGAYRMTAQRDGFALLEKRVEVPAASPVDLELALSPVIDSVETVSKVKESSVRVPFFVSTVNPEELAKTVPATVEDTVRSVPGLQYGSQGNAFSRISTRGFRDTADVLTLIDGMPLRQLAGAADLTMLPVQMVREVEFVKGPASSVYGRSAVAGTDAVLFVTPEYNRSVPGVLKNAIDVGSRPYGHSVWSDKPGAVISVSPGALAAFGANHHLRQSLVFLDVLPMQQPEAYIGGASGLFDAGGALVNDATREFLGKFMTSFAGWIERVRRDTR